ncbi:hypothetical protein GCM10012285_09520 [Streptomyces kronopolitis]|uniref:Site-specific integrase n=1 Tax=Streptomyces kronopolitis TaxID=1612435 RepID=A0ABQ2IZP4_9ACTN|nr:hypothetical protein [Streptomyces kronopolitis]GGN36059.1 hypothetical protein GCM10012285_09520 [Streptomyces kronopolitis]
MTATVLHDPIGIAYTTVDGVGRQGQMPASDCPDLAQDLMAGLVNLIHPHGRLTTRSAIDKHLISARRLVLFLHTRGFTGGAGDLSRTDMIEFWMSAQYVDERNIRFLLKAWDEETGRLPLPVRLMTEGRTFNQRDPSEAFAPYSEAEWSRLLDLCHRNVREAFTAHAEALAAARRGHDPRESGDWSTDNLCWLQAHHGPVTFRSLKFVLGVRQKTALVVRRQLAEARTALFPQPDMVISYQLLFGAYSGIVPDGIDGLGLTDLDWTGDSEMLLNYVKGRTSRESLNLSRKAVRLLERWLEHSAPLRSLAPDEDRGVLWIRDSSTHGGNAVETTRMTDISVRAWVRRHGLLDDSGAPFPVHRQRIRTTFHSHRDRRTWAGSPRVTIDPNHTPAVEGDHYLTAATPAQQRAVQALIEEAQGDLLRRAQAPTVLSEEDTVALARDYPQVIAQLKLDDTAIDELVGGERDVFVAACADQLAGLHGPKGKPCPARPWVCLLCPLAVFAPRHAANLLRLKAFFARQWRQLPADHFMAVFGPYAQRVTQVLDCFDPAVLAAAAPQVADADEELPLRPEERTA